jgi:pyrroloquinoline-quinone synthase
MDFWYRIDEVRARHDVLQHPFYLRWSRGELTRAELSCYAGEYRNAVVALADAAADAASVAGPELAPELAAHAAEEAEHVGLWYDFAAELGADISRDPLPETIACTRVWARHDRPLLESLVALYAIESGQPAISETKRQGLLEHYAINSSRATAYFDLHVRRDVEHAAAGKALIDTHLDGADEARLLREAEAVLRANWRLLDGVDRH